MSFGELFCKRLFESNISYYHISKSFFVIAWLFKQSWSMYGLLYSCLRGIAKHFLGQRILTFFYLSTLLVTPKQSSTPTIG